MGNGEISEIREFGTGLREHLELHGVRMDARSAPPSNVDLFELFVVTTLRLVPSVLTLQPAALAA